MSAGRSHRRQRHAAGAVPRRGRPTTTGSGPQEAVPEDAEIAALRALEADATAGPWKVSDSHGLCVVVKLGGMIADMSPGATSPGWEGEPADADFIVAARNAMPRILDLLASRHPVHGALGLCAGTGTRPTELGRELREGESMCIGPGYGRCAICGRPQNVDVDGNVAAHEARLRTFSVPMAEDGGAGGKPR